MDLSTKRERESVYPLGGNLIKSNFHLFKKKHAREREEHLAPSSLRHPWGVLGLRVGVQGQSPNSLLLSLDSPAAGLLLPLLHDSLQEMSSPLQADAITSANGAFSLAQAFGFNRHKSTMALCSKIR